MRWVQPWYSAYAAVGMMVLGVAPILIPLTVEAGGKNGATMVGLVVAAFYVGGLFAPVLGSMADRAGRQRAVFLWSFPIMAIAIVGFALSDQVWLWALLALVFGGLGSLSGTVAGLFVVEANPEREWNSRLSWFRLAYGAGQVVGLVVAAVAVNALLGGWLLTAVVVAAGFLLGRIGLPKLGPAPAPAPEAASSASANAHGSRGAAAGSGKPRRRGLVGLPLFLIVWLLAMAGIQTFFNVVPLIMRDGFAVDPSASSLLFLLGAAIGTAVYPIGGFLANRMGAGLVLLIGLIATAASFAAMALSDALAIPGKSVIASVALVVAAIAYSFEVVAATMMIVKITPGSEGSAMGLLNGTIAAGAVIGAVVPSFLAAAWGYGILPLVALCLVIVAALVAVPLYRPAVWQLTQLTQPAHAKETPA